MPNPWIVPTIIALLCIYAIAALVGLALPSNDPQRGMAIGFINMLLVLLAILGGLLWVGTHPYRPFLVWTLLVITVYPALMLCAMQVYSLIRSMRSR